ncbi:MAG: peptide chain release factor N(5)-glutamine methyltransferase, partial [Ornithinimicrobium sp.]|nr:peptide chain release factor N(5)-glutamine methyltransferase [Ornithinimicrobium sp.]
RVGAVELSPEAHRYAVANAAQTGLVIDLRLGPAQESFGDWAGTVDVVVSNPPYIPTDAVPIDPEVRDHDPALALYGGGEDGLDLPRALGEQAAVLLRPGALLLMEHAEAQGVSLPAALAAQGHWDTIEDLPDLGGRPRVTRARQTRRARDH